MELSSLTTNKLGGIVLPVSKHEVEEFSRSFRRLRGGQTK